MDVNTPATDKLTPFRIAITETYVKEVEIYAPDEATAHQMAEDLCWKGEIQLEHEHFVDRSTECRGIARPIDLELHDVVKDGMFLQTLESKTCTDEDIACVLLDELENAILIGEYATWEDLCVEIDIPDIFRPYNKMVVWGEENDAGEKHFSVSLRRDDEEIYKTFSNSNDFIDLEEAVYRAFRDIRLQQSRSLNDKIQAAEAQKQQPAGGSVAREEQEK